jgi:hypothetical protein
MTSKSRLLALILAGFASAAMAADDSQKPEQATIPLEVLPPPGNAAVASGRDHMLKVELHQPLRSVRAIFATVAPGPLPLMIIGPISRWADGSTAIPTDPARLAWCTHDRGLRFIVGQNFTCWQDRDDDGKLETALDAVAATSSQPLTIALVGRSATAITPTPYREARPEERNSYDLEYIPCSPVETGYYRRKLHGSPGVTMVEGCRFQAKPVEGQAVEYQVDHMRFRVDPTGTAQLISGPKAGSYLDRYGDELEMAELGSRPSLTDEAQAKMAPFAAEAFQFATPPILLSGAVTETQDFIEAPMRYGYSALLKTAVATAKFSLAAETPLYGIPMGGPTLSNVASLVRPPSMIWCYPYRLHDVWTSSCFLATKAGDAEQIAISLVEDFGLPFMITTVRRAVRAEIIAKATLVSGPAALGVTPIIRYRLDQWRKKDVRLILSTHVNGMPAGQRILVAPRQADGSVRLTFGKGELRLKQIDKGEAGPLVVEVITPLAEGDAVEPQETVHLGPY